MPKNIKMEHESAKSSEDMTSAVAVKRLVNCFETANKEINKALDQKVPERELKARVKLFVGDALRKCDVDIKNPSKESLYEAMQLCKLNTEKMLGPKATPIIKKHYKEMNEIIEKLPD